jgi:hypothetical protein
MVQNNYTWHIEKEMRRNRKGLWASLILGVLAVVLSVWSLSWNTYTKKLIDTLHSPKKVVLEHSSPVDIIIALDSWSEKELNDDNVLAFMGYVGIEHPHIVLAQMKLESGNYTSKLALENNNYFGMKQPRKRATTSIGEKNGFASYKNWACSVLDYALWQRTYASNLSEKEYLDTLATYAEDKKYITKVKKLAKNLENRK